MPVNNRACVRGTHVQPQSSLHLTSTTARDTQQRASGHSTRAHGNGNPTTTGRSGQQGGSTTDKFISHAIRQAAVNGL